MESWLLSVIANVFCRILTNIVCNFTKYNEDLDIILKEFKGNYKILQYSIQILKKARKNLMIYFILENILMLFFIYYLNIFCALYHQSQKALIKNYLIGNLNSLLYSIGFAFIITIFRLISLYYHELKFFLISKYLESKF